MLQVIPAIDLLEGRVVRLAEGRRDRATVYGDDPLPFVERFAKAGASLVHVVDLEGAFAGRPAQVELLSRVAARARELGVAIQSGGGIRDAAAVETLIEHGVSRVVVGTLAVREPEVVEGLCTRHPGAIVVAIDARDGLVAVDGWTTTSTMPATELATRAAAWGAAALLFTDVRRDGLQVGAEVEATAALQQLVDIPVIASGGIGSLRDLIALRDAGVRAVVVGRALYEGNFTVEEALSC
jgi:phosphoribosylformimino-5-aminoimidazole carboxamide ribotide isomerase